MRRREFITLASGAAVWPLVARAETSSFKVGVLIGANLGEEMADAVRQGLQQAGFSEGQNASIEYRSADGRYERLPALANDLVRDQVSVIVTIGGIPPALAAKAATQSIPIVFSNGGDPIKLGLVSSLNRPTGNVTGVSFLLNALAGKRMELLHTLMPTASVIGFLVNPLNPSLTTETNDVKEAAIKFGQEIKILNASDEHLFVAPHACKVVDGDISPSGWCKEYAMAD
jgi:putative tryptophan/tyrosine transport system substrate-binding protein